MQVLHDVTAADLARHAGHVAAVGAWLQRVPKGDARAIARRLVDLADMWGRACSRGDYGLADDYGRDMAWLLGLRVSRRATVTVADLQGFGMHCAMLGRAAGQVVTVPA
jgi:hypothetical protein